MHAHVHIEATRLILQLVVVWSIWYALCGDLGIGQTAIAHVVCLTLLFVIYWSYTLWNYQTRKAATFIFSFSFTQHKTSSRAICVLCICQPDIASLYVLTFFLIAAIGSSPQHFNTSIDTARKQEQSILSSNGICSSWITLCSYAGSLVPNANKKK